MNEFQLKNKDLMENIMAPNVLAPKNFNASGEVNPFIRIKHMIVNTKMA